MVVLLAEPPHTWCMTASFYRWIVENPLLAVGLVLLVFFIVGSAIRKP
jgi:hypothetical protein